MFFSKWKFHFRNRTLTVNIMNILIWILLVVKIVAGKSSLFKILTNSSINNEYNNSIIRVSTQHYEPFIYQDKHGQFYKGIEYNIIESIAKKLNKTVSYRVWKGHPRNYNPLLSKYKAKNHFFYFLIKKKNQYWIFKNNKNFRFQ